MSCGFIPNEKTLIEKIYKVVPGCKNICRIDYDEIILKVSNTIYTKESNFCEKKYKDMLLVNIEKKICNNKIGFAISSGFDSNLLISLYNNKYKKINNFFIIGGAKGINEIPTVKEIISIYKYDKFYSSFVDKNTFKEYSKIVYMYEGLFYERGIFLQYELYK